MSLLGGALSPPSADPRWGAWARPVVAFFRCGVERRTADVVRFAARYGAGQGKALDLLAWCLTEELLVSLGGGRFVAAPRAGAWLGDYALPAASGPVAIAVGDRIRLEDLPRQVGDLFPLRVVGKDARRNTLVLCACACGCGGTATVRASRLRTQSIRSCGRKRRAHVVRREAA